MTKTDQQNAALRLRHAKRLVIKIGSSLLAEGDHLRLDWMADLAEDVRQAKASGQEVIIVSSGAIAAGRGALGLEGELRLEESQAAAAAGQIILAHGWREALAGVGLSAAQLLLTLGDTEDRRRYINARACLRALLALGAVPVINENDTVATQEIRYGDNDRLAARIADMAGGDCLLLLSQVDGLYQQDPAMGASGHIPYIAAITPEIESMAGGAGNALSRGGMKTKIEAAKIASRAGCAMIIASGREAHPLARVLDGARCSLFAASQTPATARKRWIASALEVRGKLFVDAGAAAAIKRGRSLLPAGVVKIEGAFGRGDAVLIANPAGAGFAVGLSAYTAEEATRLAGQQSGEIARILGWRGRDEMIHRDDLALLDGEGAGNG